jgi:hypothetical protein
MSDDIYNALTHGITAQSIILPSEHYDDWEEHQHAIVKSYEPDTPLEQALASRIAEILWRLRRVARAESDLVAATQDHLDDWYNERLRIGAQSTPPQIPPRPPVAARIPEQKDADHIIRYEAHLNRQLTQTMHELEALQSRRQGKDTPLARVDFLSLARNL